MVQPRLALAKTFLQAYSRLPKKQQKKVRQFTERFTEDPTRSGLNFERLSTCADPKVRSLRVDQAYRVIVVQADRGDVLLCVWVDHHDEAYRWAERKHFEVNPISGVLQVFSVEEGQQAVAQAEAPLPESEPSRLFAAFDDMFKSLLFVATSSGALFWAQLAFQCAATVARGGGRYSEGCTEKPT